MATKVTLNRLKYLETLKLLAVFFGTLASLTI